MGPFFFLEYLDPHDKELVTQFFGTFAGAEYALKASGYVKPGRDDGASANWEAYSKAIAGVFKKQRDAEFRNAWSDLTSYPPRKQVIRDGHLSWLSTERPHKWSDEQWGLLLTRRVRNNLFHGAKFLLSGTDSHSRDRDLVRAALVITQRALSNPPSYTKSRSHRVA